MSQGTKAGLLWIETSLNSIISHCSDKEIKANLRQAKYFLMKAIDQAFAD